MSGFSGNPDDLPPPPPPIDFGVGLPPMGAIGLPPNLVPKPVIHPKQKLKPFHWATVPPNQVEQTVWAKLDDTAIPLDTDTIENLFSAKKATQKKVDTGPEAAPQEEHAKSKKTQLVDPKRAYQIDIILSRFKISTDGFKDAILSMNERLLTPEKINVLLKILPTDEDFELVKNYEGPLDQLSGADQFARAMGEIPKVKTRLELLLFRDTFVSEVSELEEDLSQVERGLKALQDSQSFRKLLTIILAVGNYINGGTQKGGAYGFKLSTLLKLRNQKTADNRLSLLHYVVQFVKEKFPDVLGFLQDLAPCATKVDAGFFREELGRMEKMLDTCKRELDGAIEDEAKQDRFKEIIGEFHERAAKRATALRERLDNAVKGTQTVAASFGEADEIGKWEELFVVIGEFCNGWRASERELAEVKRKEEEAAKRQKNMDEQRARRKAVQDREAEEVKAQGQAHAAAGGAAAGNASVFDNVHDALSSATTNTILEEIRLRQTQAKIPQQGPAVGLMGLKRVKAKRPGPALASRRAVDPNEGVSFLQQIQQDRARYVAKHTHKDGSPDDAASSAVSSSMPSAPESSQDVAALADGADDQ